MWKLTKNLRDRLFKLGFRTRCSESLQDVSRRNGSIRSVLECAQTVADLRDVSVYLAHSDQLVTEAARSVIDRIIRSANWQDLIALERSADSYIGGYGDKREWNRNFLTEIAESSPPQEFVSVLALFTFHQNGYVRHEAVRALASSTDGFALPFLMLRCNDWVWQIADDALAAIQNRFDVMTPDQRTLVLPLLGYLKRCERSDFSALVDSVLRRFLEPSHHDDAVAALRTKARGLGRMFAELALSTPGEHQLRLLSSAISSNLPAAQILFCKHMPNLLEPQAIAMHCCGMQQDPVMAVRRTAYQVEAESCPNNAGEIWQRAMFDLSYALRDLARFELARLGETDHAARYRASLKSQPDSYGALIGLADTAQDTDADILREYLSHAFPSRRIHAVRGLGRALGERAVDDLLPLLHDGNRKVLRRVSAFFRLHPYLIDGDTLLDLARTAESLNARLNTIAVAATCLAKWDSIVWLIRCAATDDPIVSKAAEQAIVERLSCNRNFTRPSSKNIAEIEQLTPKAKSLSEETKAILLSTLRLVK